jgi:hypothetical protein
MNTQKNNLPLEEALQNLKSKHRVKIISSYNEVKQRYNKASYDTAWDTSGLSVGKFCESVLRFLQDELTKNYIPYGKHIPNFAIECNSLISLPKNSGLESLRIIIPRALIFLYTIRGKRGIGHVGGDVEANEIDASTIVKICDWVFCELIRIYHGLSLEEAQSIIDSISEKEIPLIWKIGGKKRILNKNLNYKQKTLLLIYSETENGVYINDLFDWVEHSHLTNFKRDVLKQLHKEKFIEFDNYNNIVYISPIGINEVELNILSKK